MNLLGPALLSGALIAIFSSVVTSIVNNWFVERRDGRLKKYAKEKEGRAMLSALISEIEENETMVGEAKKMGIVTKLSVESFNLYKKDLDYLYSTPRNSVLSLYSKIKMYNDVVEISKTTTFLKNKLEKIADLLSSVRNELEGSYLAVDEDLSDGLTFEKGKE